MNYKGDFSGALNKVKDWKLKIESQALQTEISRELAREVGQIVKRTQSGRDKNGAAFKGYSKGYAKAKGAAGRSGTVDLTLSASMMQALQWKLETVGKQIIGKIFISPEQADKALRHIKGDGVPRRDFLGFTKQFIKNINRIVKEAFTNDR